jgi:galactokinase
MDRSALTQAFVAAFPGASVEGDFIARAPGRVNLIGEHTDYNDGFVCPMAIDRETRIFAVPRQDAVVRIHSITARETATFPINHEVPKGEPAWALYPKGAAEAIRQKVNLHRGFDAVVFTNVPLGGGLSSSASFEVATATALLAANNAQLPSQEVALACQWAEHHYPKMPCGIMDQFISAAGKSGHALLLDCRDLSTRHVPLDDPDIRIVISNSNVKHALVGGEYKRRREQCEEAVAVLRKADRNIRALRDVTEKQLKESRDGMDRIPYRRAQHVVTEIARTLEFADALTRCDCKRCGELMFLSHESLRHEYEVSCPELDALVEIARQVPGVYGARMTGGGFGGCIVALCRASAVTPLTAAIDAEYPKRCPGKHATTFSTVASAGASVE